MARVDTAVTRLLRWVARAFDRYLDATTPAPPPPTSPVGWWRPRR